MLKIIFISAVTSVIVVNVMHRGFMKELEKTEKEHREALLNIAMDFINKNR